MYYIVETKYIIQEAGMNTFCFSSEKEKSYALACLKFAQKLGLIEDSSLEAVRVRCEAENEKRAKQIADGGIVYGLKQFSLNAYLDYELTRFKLDFVSENEEIKKVYSYKEISKKDKKAFYKNNKDLFTRYNGDKFWFYESKMIIEKKIREEQYENEINNILCKLS